MRPDGSPSGGEVQMEFKFVGDVAALLRTINSVEEVVEEILKGSDRRREGWAARNNKIWH